MLPDYKSGSTFLATHSWQNILGGRNARNGGAATQSVAPNILT